MTLTTTSTLLSSTFEEEVVDMVVNKGHGVKGLTDLGLHKLPKRFIQPVQERISSMLVLPEESIPIIDMSNWDNDPKVMDSICEAAEKWGFFQVVNHGVPMAVLDNVKKAAVRFFDLPPEKKMKYSKGRAPNNNLRFTTSFVPDLEEALEWKDSLSLVHVSNDEAHALWPSVCKNEVLDHMASCEDLLKKLFIALMKGLNVQNIDEKVSSVLMGSRRINLIWYPICPSPDLTVGVGRHSDVSTLTILLQDQTGGLYVRKLNSNGWIHVPPVSGSLVVNVGDVLEIMSNGRYKSVEHRVFPPSTKNRFSVPVFANPRPSDFIGPLPELLKNGEQQLYKQVLYSDYVKNFFKNAHNGKATLDFAKV